MHPLTVPAWIVNGAFYFDLFIPYRNELSEDQTFEHSLVDPIATLDHYPE